MIMNLKMTQIKLLKLQFISNPIQSNPIPVARLLLTFVRTRVSPKFFSFLFFFNFVRAVRLVAACEALVADAAVPPAPPLRAAPATPVLVVLAAHTRSALALRTVPQLQRLRLVLCVSPRPIGRCPACNACPHSGHGSCTSANIGPTSHRHCGRSSRQRWRSWRSCRSSSWRRDWIEGRGRRRRRRPIAAARAAVRRTSAASTRALADSLPSHIRLRESTKQPGCLVQNVL